jgi:hypothetical protein
LEAILVLLIAGLLSGALIFVDDALKGLVPICLNAENYMSTMSGVNWFSGVYNLMFDFGISLIILKFLKKGFETYISWTEGDADTEPLELLTGFIKALVVAISFPTLYGWLVKTVTELTDKLLQEIAKGTDVSFASVISGIASAGLFTAIVSLVFFIIFFFLYIQFLVRGIEMLILRIGVPLACVGLLDSDKGVFGMYIKKFFQSTLAIIVQISLAKLAVGMMLNAHVFWGIAGLTLALKAPQFIQDFLLVGSSGGGITNKIYTTTRIASMAKGLFVKK